MSKNKIAIKRDFSGMPLSSSLAHLAYGHIAFLAWRKKKIEHNKKNEKK